MNNINSLLTAWKNATAELGWGTQRAFHDVLTLAGEEKTTLVYNADYYDKGACLVNQAGNILVTGGGRGVPMANFGPVVSLFDQLNRAFKEEGVNTDGNYVSPLAAEILVRNFAPLRSVPENKKDMLVHSDGDSTYIEPTDEQFQQTLMEMLAAPEVPEYEDAPEPSDVEG